jgi:predicted secreted protein
MMKRTKQGLFVLLLSICGVAMAIETPILTDLTKPILVKADQEELIIHLKSNATTGYQWFIKHYDHDLLTLEGQRYLLPTDRKLMGAPGMTELKFHVNPSAHLAAQISTVIVFYARPWEAIPKNADGEQVITWVSAMKEQAALRSLN